MRRPLPIKLQIYNLNMSPYLIIHHLSLPNLGIRKQSRQAEERVFPVPPTSCHKTMTQSSNPSCLWAPICKVGKEVFASPWRGDLCGASLRRFGKKTFWCYWGHYNHWTNYLFETSIWASATKILRVSLEKYKPTGVYSRASYLLTRLSIVSLAASSSLFIHRR